MTVPLKPVIYQLVVRYFGNTNTTNRPNGTLATNGCGRFADIDPVALQAIRRLGATHIWLTGCLRQATLTSYPGIPADDPDVCKGIAGSLFAVRDYFDVCPDYAIDATNRLAEFEDLIRRIHAAGMKAILDFVPNHVARGYHSLVRPEADFGLRDDTTKFFDPQNGFFYLVDPPNQRLQLSRPPWWNPPGFVFDGSFPPEDGEPGHVPKVTGDNCTSPRPDTGRWYETVKLNYGYNFVNGASQYDPLPRTWTLMDKVLAYWQAKGVDGFRCDMAHMIPREAWQFLIAGSRRRDPACLFLAEAYPNGGPGYPSNDPDVLVAAGFDAVYQSSSYDALKRIYMRSGTADDYDRTVTPLTARERAVRVVYLENHDERRIASPLAQGTWSGDSGFGSADAGYQLGPLHYLFGNGPVLFLNGQEVGEPGAGAAGFSTNCGRTTTFDYWCMPELAKWVNQHAYDGGGLSASQSDLRRFYAALLAVCQDSAIRGDGYWGLKYFNRSSRFSDCPDDLYTFARFREGAGRLLLVAGCFRPGGVSGQIRLPLELINLVNLRQNVTVRLVLDRGGRQNQVICQLTTNALAADGFSVFVPNQTSHVYEIE
jgi:glycosidase